MKRLFIPLLLLLLPLTALGETITLSFVGDCTVGEQWCYRNYKSGYVYKISQSGFDYPFSLCAYLFEQDDLTVANCEGSFTNAEPANKKKKMSLSAPKSYARVFREGHVDVVNYINNHSQDFGTRGKNDTIAALTENGIGYFGGAWVWETEIKGVKIGFCGQTYHLSEYTMRQYQALFDQLRADGCTFIIASVHWGREDSHDLNDQQYTYGTRLIDMGADMVYGHGSHTLQPVQYYNGHLILYSTGNFTFGANGRPKDMDTAVFQVQLQVQEDGTAATASLKVIPYCVCWKGDFRPYPYTLREDQLRVWQKLVFTGKNRLDPDSCLPASFLTTGYACFLPGYEEAPFVATPSDLREAYPEPMPSPTAVPTPVPTPGPTPTAEPVLMDSLPTATPAETLPAPKK